MHDPLVLAAAWLVTLPRRYLELGFLCDKICCVERKIKVREFLVLDIHEQFQTKKDGRNASILPLSPLRLPLPTRRRFVRFHIVRRCTAIPDALFILRKLLQFLDSILITEVW